MVVFYHFYTRAAITSFLESTHFSASTDQALVRAPNLTGILLAGCSLVSRAGAPQGPTSPTYQQRTAKMKKNKNYLRFLLLLFLARRMFALEIRHGDVVAFQLVGAPVNLFNLASGHHRRRGASMFFRRRVHYGLICGPHDFCRSTGRAMMFCQYRFASDI